MITERTRQKQFMHARETPAYLVAEHITATYADRPALDDVTFSVPAGTRVAVVGPNGAGKSTLFKAIVGLLPLQSGRITLHERSVGQRQECVAYVPQRAEIDWRFPVTVCDVVMMGRYAQMGWMKRPARQDHDAVKRALAQMGIANLAAAPISELSGGQQQRVFLARALAQEPHILLMDEPFTGVDMTTQETMLALLEHVQTRGVTLMVSTHDLNLAATRFDCVLLLNKRLIAYGAPAHVFTAENVTRAFGTQAMFVDGKMVVDECCPPDQDLTGF